MKLKAEMALILLWALSDASAIDNGNLTLHEEPNAGNEQAVDLHSRRKRYIVFPQGASLQLLLEELVHVPTQFRVVVGPTLQVAWPVERLGASRSKRSSLTGHSERKMAGKYKILSDLASLVDVFGTTLGLAWRLPDDPMIHREFKKKHKMYKRDVFKKMEQFLHSGGSNGRQCILKALCESGQRTPSKKEFLREILHKIFSMEAEEGDADDTEEEVAYRKAHRSLNQNCETLYPDCQFSIFGAIQ